MGGQVVADDGFGHEGFLSLAELADPVMDALESIDARLNAGALVAEEPLALGGVVSGEDGADGVEWDLEVAQPADCTGRFQLIAAISSIAGEGVDLGRREQAGLVV